MTARFEVVFTRRARRALEHDLPEKVAAAAFEFIMGTLAGNPRRIGNPLRLRRALDAGVRVVVAHCASMGQDRDLDAGANGPPP